MEKDKPKTTDKYADRIFTVKDLVAKLEKEGGGTFKNYYDNVIVIDKCPEGGDRK